MSRWCGLSFQLTNNIHKMTKKVAIVGMSFRFPGTNTAQYWPDLLDGKNLISSVEEGRWAKEAYLHPDKNHPGTSYTFAAGSIGNVTAFDAAFFGISPREAALMDPQQRLLLEMTWEAFENAGVKPSSVRGTKCGVYVGISSADYAYRLAEDLGTVDSTVATGNTASIAANRISYVFDLRGPSMALDTACSSSLVAFHQACRSVASGESSLAVTGGVSLHLHPYGFIAFSKASMLSRRGICNVFDAAGDGYVRSEGGGIFVLKDYDQALADGDQILAVVAASAINSDGKKSGLTVPSGDAQASLLTEVYEAAGISADEIDYIEAHGTGTAVGDPIETRALGAALGTQRSRHRPLLIGSVKSNVGHLEAASGVAGLVKAIHCVMHRTVPATIHLENPNPNIRFDEWNLEVAQRTTALKSDGRLVVGVNSFGFGGANAHVILETPAHQLSRPDVPKPTIPPKNAQAFGAAVPSTVAAQSLPIVISGRTRDALKAAAAQTAASLATLPQSALYDFAYSGIFHRDLHECRAVLFGDDCAQLSAALARFSEGVDGPLVVDSGVALPEASPVCLVFSGNGSQWEGMGQRLIREDAVFARAVREVDRLFARFKSFSIEAELLGKNGTGRYQMTEVAQPALFAMQVGIVEMMRSRGVMADAVVGHSVGEVAAAWASGALSLEAAVEVVFQRSRLQGETRGKGRMTAAALGGDDAAQVLAELGLAAKLSIAGVNSFRGVTFAGLEADLAPLEAALAAKKVFYKRLDLDYAFHSPAMDSIEAGILESLQGLSPRTSATTFVSTVTGGAIDGSELTAGYWWHNIRQPVLFEAAIKTLLERDVRIFIEVGPHTVLRGYINDALKNTGREGRVIATVLRGNDGAQRVRTAVAQVIINEGRINWGAVFTRRGKYLALPVYAWQREDYRHPITVGAADLLHRYKKHPLLGYRVQGQETLWENVVDPLGIPMLADHIVGEACIFPGSAFVELALAAAREQFPGEVGEIEELEIHAPLILTAEHAKLVRVAVRDSDGAITITGKEQRADEAWTRHASGRILAETNAKWLAAFAPGEFTPPTRAPDFDAATHLALTQTIGLDYGPAFQAIHHGWVDGALVTAALVVPPSIGLTVNQYLMHPAILDCAFQTIIHLMRERIKADKRTTFVPVKIGRLRSRLRAGSPAYVRATLLKHSPHSLLVHFALFDEAGNVIAVLDDVRFKSVRLKRNAADHLRLLTSRAVAKPLSNARSAPVVKLDQYLRDAIERAGQQLGDNAVYRTYREEFEPLIDLLCGAFASKALKQIFGTTAPFSHDTVLQWARSHPDGAPLLLRLVGMLEEDGFIESVGEKWRFVDTPEAPSAEDIWNSLLADYPEHFLILNAVGRVGLHLNALLTATQSLQSVLPKDTDWPILFSHALGDEATRALGRGVVQAVTQAINRLTEGQRLTIVEVGGGAPLFAEKLLPHLPPDRIDYAIVSCHALALDASQRMAERFAGVQCRILGDEGTKLLAGKCHLVLVSADLATDDDTNSVLAFASTALMPSGSLVCVTVPSARWKDFVFGAKPSWWHAAGDGVFTAANGSALTWRDKFAHVGFAEARTISLAPGSGTAGETPTLFLATADARKVISILPRAHTKRHWVVLVDDGVAARELREALVRRLAAAGDSVSLVGSHVETGARRVVDASLQRLNLANPNELATRLAAIRADVGEIDGILNFYGFGANREAAIQPKLELDQQTARCMVAAALMNACEKISLPTTCWMLTSGALANLLPKRRADLAAAFDAPTLGFVRSMMNEARGVNIRLIDIERPSANASLCDALIRELSADDNEREAILTVSGERFVPRVSYAPRRVAAAVPSGTIALAGAQASRPTNVRLGFSAPGQLRNLRWEAAPHIALGQDDVEIDVRATGLNFRDVMYALGLLSDEAVENGFAGATLGLECAGLVTAVGARVSALKVGDPVLAFGPSSFANRVVTNANGCAKIPDGIGFEAAATIPSTFLTSYYALKHLAQLQEGERLLIHGAAGGVGIAAIQIAKLLGAEVYASAGSDEKRDFLTLLGVEHIVDSRSLDFADDILALTGGHGVDVVLNSLAGEAISRNLRVLKPFGRFLELGKRDFYENTHIGLRPFRNNISYFGIDADQLMQERPELTRKLFQEVMALFVEGALHALPYKTFEADHVVEAFRYMQQARQIGKIIVTYGAGIQDMHPEHQASPPLRLNPRASYLVTGGLGGFGLASARWLIEKGARNLVLVGRRGLDAPEAKAAVAEMERQGVSVYATACDISDKAMLSELLNEISINMAPLRGVIHAAAVIEDSLIANLTEDNLRRVLAPKLQGARNLHELTQSLPLDMFVLFSSATTVFGNPGQAGYVAANTYMESLAEARRAMGFRATCIGWGAIDDVGFLARNTKIKEALQGRMGGAALSSSLALAMLEEMIVTNRSDLAILNLEWRLLAKFLPAATAAKFSEIAAASGDGEADGNQAEDIQEMMQTLSPEALSARFIEMLKVEIGEILRIPPDKIDETRSVYDMGLDSLMGVELGLAVESRFGVRLPVMALSDSQTIAKLADKVLLQLRQAEDGADANKAGDHVTRIESVVSQHAADVDSSAIHDFAKDLDAAAATQTRKMIT